MVKMSKSKVTIFTLREKVLKRLRLLWWAICGRPIIYNLLFGEIQVNHNQNILLMDNRETWINRIEFLDELLVELLVSTRNHLREIKQWQLADDIRDRLSAVGITIMDRPGQTTFKYRGEMWRSKSMSKN